jgi:hypothetical protein
VKSEERDRRYGNGNGRVLQYVLFLVKCIFFKDFICLTGSTCGTCIYL